MFQNTINSRQFAKIIIQILNFILKKAAKRRISVKHRSKTLNLTDKQILLMIKFHIITMSYLQNNINIVNKTKERIKQPFYE